MGPTASGKTALAIALRKVLPVELISVDSALIYRGMDIGTAKPDAAELSAAPHRLLDILDPAEAYSAADFRRDALAEMADIVAAGRIPLLVGGTMLYFKALLEGLSPLPSADPQVRAKIEQQAAEQGGVLQSYSNDGESGTFDLSQSIFTEEGKARKTKEIIYRYLGDTGLLYQGV